MDRRTAIRTIGAATAALGMGGIGLASVKPSNGCVLPKSERQTLHPEWLWCPAHGAYVIVEPRPIGDLEPRHLATGRWEYIVYARKHLLSTENKHRLDDDQFYWELGQIVVNAVEYEKYPTKLEAHAQVLDTSFALHEHLAKQRPAGRQKYYHYIPIDKIGYKSIWRQT